MRALFLDRPALVWPCLLAPLAGQTQFRELTRSVLPPAASAALSVAATDADGDGDVDLALGGSSGNVALFTNLCGGSFRDDSARLPPPAADAVHGLAFGDVDRDGDPDLVLATSGQERVLVQGAGRFSDETSTRMPVGSDDSRALIVLDVDRDGDLDLFVANSGQDRLYLNDGRGTFTDGTAGRLPAGNDDSRAAVAVDVDRDGDLDLFVGLASGGKLWRNDGAGRFVDASSLLGGAMQGTTSAVATADVNRDGLPDLFAAGSSGLLVFIAQASGFYGYGSGSTDRTLAFGDLDNDGWVDLFAHGEAETTVRFNTRREPWLGGSFGAVPLRPDPLSAALLVDLDLDADRDLVAASLAGTRVLFNDGEGRFLAQPERDLPETMRDVEVLAAADVDRDGDVDVLMSSVVPTSGYESLLYHNDGHGRFALGAYLSASRMVAAHFVDVTGDGRPDFVGASQFGKELYVNRSGTFVSEGHWLPVSPYLSRAVASGDVDADGDVDLLFGNYGPAELLLNDGTGRFSAAGPGRLPSVADSTSQVALFDLDGDRDLDLVIANQGRPNRVLRNDGTGTFTDLPRTQFAAAAEQTRAVAVGDFDGDGDIDVVFGNWGQSRAYRADPSGFVDVTATALPAAQDATNALAFGDVDSDGDLDLVLGNLGSLRLLLNDGRGAFSDATATRMPALDASLRAIMLIDSDRDGDLDLFTGASPGRPRLLANLTRQAAAAGFAVVGCTHHIDFHIVPWRLLPRTIVPFVSGARLPTPLATPFGWLGLDPTQLVGLPALQTTTGSARLTLPIPLRLSLRGATLHVQALMQCLAQPADWHLSNVVSDRIGS